MKDPKEIIKYWYEQIGFPSDYDEAFEQALKAYEIDPEKKVADYEDKGDGAENFLYFLYFCEELKQKYREKGISEDVMRDTVSDMPVWLDIWSELKGGMYLGELDWFEWHFTMKLFKLGRLQYCFKTMSRDIPELGVAKGDKVIDMHIPALGPFSPEDCKESLDMARAFFAKYYPEYKYDYFTCHSWLLDEELVELLGENSNIVKFGRMFKIVERFESNAILSYILRWKIKREEVASVEPKSALARKVKELALEGKVFHGGYGFIRR